METQYGWIEKMPSMREFIAGVPLPEFKTVTYPRWFTPWGPRAVFWVASRLPERLGVQVMRLLQRAGKPAA